MKVILSRKRTLLATAIGIVVLLVALLVFYDPQSTQQPRSSQRILSGFSTDTSRASIDLAQLVDGGPGKDGIPALTHPTMVPLSESTVADDVLGILVNFHSQQRFYPFTMLVWHEIVNDTIRDVAYAATFCPLCQSAILFDRRVEGNLLEFRVSGLLYESNLVMYDTETESLWSQAKNEAIAGYYTGTRLTILPFEHLSFGQVKTKYPHALVMSADTGFDRDYSFNPYSTYEDSDDLFFPVSIQDKRFPPKEVMYVVPFDGQSVAITQQQLTRGERAEFDLDGRTLVAVREGENIIVTESSKTLPGYYEMWFSWATHHQENGIVWEL